LGLREKGTGFVSDGNSQSALREWRRHMSHPVTLIALAGVGGVLGITGPFDTDTHLALFPRLIYWLAIVAATYAISALTHGLLRPVWAAWPLPLRILAGGIASGIGVAFVVLGLNLAVLGYWPAGQKLLPFVGTILAISLVVTATLAIASRHLASTPTPPDTLARPALLDRLPLNNRGPLVAVSVEDHYVRIRTTKGETLVLMRLGDAIGETTPAQGAQVHRSHWAAYDQVRAARREGDRAILTMSVGPDIPVSRANLSKIKEAGLLPQ